MNRIFFLILLASTMYLCHAQDLDLLDDDEPTTDYTAATFKTNRVVNSHSIETVAKGEFDFKISHRFGFVSGGFYDLFGLDQATMRIGGDFGITDNLNVGIGRSNEAKTYDGFVKYKFLRQSTGAKNRDRYVLALCKKNNIPVAISMGGGYSERIALIIEAHANTLRLAQEIFF